MSNFAHEDIKELQETFDERYVQQKACSEKQEDINRRFSEDDKRLALLHHDLSIFKKLAIMIATAVVAQLVVSFFQLILK